MITHEPNRWLVLVLALAGGGCSLQTRQGDPGQAKVSPLEHSHPPAIYERTGRTFARALYLAPESDGTSDLPMWMAPLLVQEMGVGSSERDEVPSFGAVTANAAGQGEVDTTRPVLYYLTESVMLDGRDWPLLTFLWFYPPAGPGQALRLRGFRMVVDERGFGVLWEVCSSEEPWRVFYAGEPVEQAARRAWGPPLPGRRFSVEPSLETRPDVWVARVLTEGPQPMGPFVYLDHAGLSVTTLLCRCMTAQVDGIERRASYRLVRLGSLAELVSGSDLPGNVPLPASSGSWDGVLRWPTGFRTGR